MTGDDPWALLGLAGHPAGRTRPAPGAVATALRVVEAAGSAAPAGAGLTTAALLPALGDVVPAALARHRSLGLPDDVSRATLADVGRKVDAYGEDVDAPWLLGLLRADVVAVGRLQVERVAGAHGHALHVPEGGPLDARAVRESVARARVLVGASTCTCTSWLLDPWLVRVLPPSSGIVAFASLFRLDELPGADRGGEPTAGDRSAARFLFRRPLEQLLEPGSPRDEEAVQRTSLQRLALGRLRSGEHWLEPRGTWAG
ncbi:acyltransferase domain-containing protein [uncultured Pseudokineococcus sp.]|uniref:acyltransferase domain-containing protein n=1 Tax=uncultured Pseudokineococcus sp. TaxID=1642928 RepID=UPI00262E0026|nr:acyltransferase domain-containing protein [uncultured Pseudokineococcus sp.]